MALGLGADKLDLKMSSSEIVQSQKNSNFSSRTIVSSTAQRRRWSLAQIKAAKSGIINYEMLRRQNPPVNELSQKKITEQNSCVVECWVLAKTKPNVKEPCTNNKTLCNGFSLAICIWPALPIWVTKESHHVHRQFCGSSMLQWSYIANPAAHHSMVCKKNLIDHNT